MAEAHADLRQPAGQQLGGGRRRRRRHGVNQPHCVNRCEPALMGSVTPVPVTADSTGAGLTWLCLSPSLTQRRPAWPAITPHHSRH